MVTEPRSLRRDVLVVDDDSAIRGYVNEVLGSHGYQVSCLDSGQHLLSKLRNQEPSVVLLDLIMPRTDGMEVLSGIRRSGHDVPVIVMSATDQTRSIVKAMRLGATDYLVKPVDEEDLVESVDAAMRLPRLQPVHRDAEGERKRLLVGFASESHDQRMKRIREVADQVADTDVPILILGETGVGKEVLAQHVHQASARSGQPFIKVNCAAVPSELLESELFGYERGAFTGAMRDKPGKFEMAGQGTLLLDEIGEMSPLLQAKLLHVLQDGECYRLGGTKPVKTAARILASTNRSLEDGVRAGSFRQDLFFRLNVVRLEIPPLRARTGDIPHLVEQFLAKYCERYSRNSPPVPPELMDAFLRYSWPGNVRQLENTIRRFVVLPEVEMALTEMARTGNAADDNGSPSTTSLREQSALAAEQTERQLVLRTLDEVNWNRKAAAKRLDICYKSLLNKLRRWEIPGRNTMSAGADLHRVNS